MNNITSSRKSVHFKDPIATESAGLLSLAVAKKSRGRPKSKLVRPSLFPLPISLKKPPPIKETRSSERVQAETAEASPKRSALRKSISEAQTSSASTNDNGERRSGRSRQDVITYNDTDTTRVAAGLSITGHGRRKSQMPLNDRPPKVDEHNVRRSGQTWSKDEKAKLRKACQTEPSWEEIQKVP